LQGNPFSTDGHWFRGNPHTHSTGSDGSLTVPELAAWYQEQGYDFLVITDHDVVTDVTDCGDASILVVPGAEIGLCWDEVLVAEILALGIDDSRGVKDHPQQVIDEVLAQGGLPYLSHPHLSGVSSTAILPLVGLSGLEIYNAGTIGWGRALSTIHWDELLTAGRMLWGLAADDRHAGAGPPDKGSDRAQGWVMVKAPSCTREHIIEAMRGGLFYSTAGPQIHDISVTANEVSVSCSPVRWISFVSLPWTGRRIDAEPGQTITEASVPLGRLGTPAKIAEYNESWVERGYLTGPRPMAAFFRVEIEDPSGARAWSNPISLEDIPV